MGLGRGEAARNSARRECSSNEPDARVQGERKDEGDATRERRIGGISFRGEEPQFLLSNKEQIF
jgi:hypothetical protein